MAPRRYLSKSPMSTETNQYNYSSAALQLQQYSSTQSNVYSSTHTRLYSDSSNMYSTQVTYICIYIYKYVYTNSITITKDNRIKKKNVREFVFPISFLIVPYCKQNTCNAGSKATLRFYGPQ